MPSTKPYRPIVETSIASRVDAEEMTLTEVEAILDHAIKNVR